MHAVTRVSVEPGLFLCQRTFGKKNVELFHPSSIERQTSYILAAISQIDTKRISKLYSFQNSSSLSKPQEEQLSSSSFRWKPIEVQVDLVSTNSMLLLPQADKSNYEDEDERKRYRLFSPGLEKEATDVLAFTDPFVEQLLSSSNDHHHQHGNNIFEEVEHESTLFCGALVICPGQMLATLGKDGRRCNEVGEMREYLLCALTHSMLHLFGYNHTTMEERDEMIAMEKKVARCVVEWLRSE